MCGIVGLHFKDQALQPQLGEWLTPMLDCLTDRGPDSAGVAIYTDEPTAGQWRYSLRSDAASPDWDAVAGDLGAALDVVVTAHPRGPAAMFSSDAEPGSVTAALAAVAPAVRMVGAGQALEIFKDVGDARGVCERHGITQRSGYQGLGHTRMATESAVTIDHSHPFAAAPDLCMVHNGSFSNYPTVRRKLARLGVAFETDNDTEVAARFLAWWLGQGATLDDGLRMICKELDGFFTLLVSTREEFAVLRDSFACKPAVIAETADYVAVGSEYRALAHLPGIEAADVFEPKPEEIYLWTR